jgi:hypothetical protein
MKPIEVTRRGESATVTAGMDGTYDKTHLPSPLVLTFYFSVEGPHIVQLVIVHNGPSLAEAHNDTAHVPQRTAHEIEVRGDGLVRGIGWVRHGLHGRLARRVRREKTRVRA